MDRKRRSDYMWDFSHPKGLDPKDKALLHSKNGENGEAGGSGSDGVNPTTPLSTDGLRKKNRPRAEDIPWLAKTCDTSPPSMNSTKKPLPTKLTLRKKWGSQKTKGSTDCPVPKIMLVRSKGRRPSSGKECTKPSQGRSSKED